MTQTRALASCAPSWRSVRGAVPSRAVRVRWRLAAPNHCARARQGPSWRATRACICCCVSVGSASTPWWRWWSSHLAVAVVWYPSLSTHFPRAVLCRTTRACPAAKCSYSRPMVGC
jgi:hypothetical protein